MILEDNAGDVILLKRALSKAGIDFQPLLFEEGESAFRYIDDDARPEAMPRLHAAILDLNVPKFDGFDVLTRIRNSPELKHIPVIVLSSLPKQLMKDRAAQANCCITKPSELNEYLSLGEQIKVCIEAVEKARPAHAG